MPRRWEWPSVDFDDAVGWGTESLNPHPTDPEPWREIPEGRRWTIPGPIPGGPPRATGFGPAEARAAMLHFSRELPTERGKTGPARKAAVYRCLPLALEFLRAQPADHRSARNAGQRALKRAGPARYRKQVISEIDLPRGFYNDLLEAGRAEGLLPPKET